MKRILLVILVFAVGVFCGIAVNNWNSSNSSSGAAGSIDENEESTPAPASAEEIEEILISDFLPNTAPYWLYIDLEKWRNEKTTVQNFLDEPEISQVWKELSGSLPQGATEAMSELTGASKNIRLFLLPPKENHPAPVWVAAATLKDSTGSSAKKPGITSLTHNFPNAASSELEAGDVTIKTLSTPLGEFAYLEDMKYLWIATNQDVLQQFWSQPPIPAKDKSEKNPHQAALDAHQDTVAALFSNIDHPGEPLPGPLGYLTARLRPLGVPKTAILFQCPNGKGKMTLVAPNTQPMPWMEHWRPIDRFPFGDDDPAGLLEAAVRWPGEGIPLSATETAPEANGANPISAATENENRMRSNNGVRENSTLDRPRGEGRDPRARRNQGNKQNKSTLAFAAQMKMRFLSQMFPAGETIGMNLFGFYNGIPTLTMAIPTFETEGSPFEMLNAIPNIESSTMEIAMLPASCYRLGNPMNRKAGLDELLVVERDAVAYLFDAEEAAKHYLSGGENSEYRSRDMRDLLEDVETPAQIEIVLSRDFFRMVLDVERENIPDDFPYREELSEFLDKLFSHTQTMTLSAGLDEGRWFMETYTESALSHWVDTALALWYIHRFMEN